MKYFTHTNAGKLKLNFRTKMNLLTTGLIFFLLLLSTFLGNGVMILLIHHGFINAGPPSSQIPLLIQTGQKSVFAASDNRTLYEFALKNIAREYFFEPGELPLTIRALDGFYLLLLPASTHTRDSVAGRCRQALTDFVTHFPFSINFFVFQKICLPESLLDAFLALKQFAAKNVTYENHTDISESRCPRC